MDIIRKKGAVVAIVISLLLVVGAMAHCGKSSASTLSGSVNSMKF